MPALARRLQWKPLAWPDPLPLFLDVPVTSTPTDPDSSPATPSASGTPDAVLESNDTVLFPVVGIGASAGGLEAFTQLLRALPPDTGMAYVLVQHLAPSHPSALAEILSRVTPMPVLEAHDQETVEPNHVYVIPPDRGMVIVRGVLELLPRGLGVHRPVDRFFRALAEDRRHQAIAVVLSGTATDGTLGLEAIKGEGGITFAQDATAQHEGMPTSAVASGCVDFVLPPGDIARELVRISRHPYAAPEAQARTTGDQADLSAVVELLHRATGTNFSHYKFNTLYRRVTRRMVFQKMDLLADYVRYLHETPDEVAALNQDILISVTSFFRNPAPFEALASQVFPRLFADRSRHDPVRIWTIGCSTGQEAYSLVMAYTEAALAAGSSVPVQVFATDLNPVGIETARAGLYPKDIAQDVSPERLRRFFTEVDGGYRISKAIRDACIFSRHDVLSDPPFSRIDLISCRNLLIYLERVLQQKVMPVLHYALKPTGFLLLGASESISGYGHLFETVDATHKLYVKKPASGPRSHAFPLQHGRAPRSPFMPVTARSSEKVDLHREADRVLSTKFAPPGVLVTADLEILQFRGDTSPYLSPAPGKASLSLLKMLREGLLVAVRAAVLQAKTDGAAVRAHGLRAKSADGYRDVAIEVLPVKGGSGKDGGFLVLFEDAGAPGALDARAPLTGTAHAPGEPSALEADHARLEVELAATREYLESLIEEQEEANEELQTANEEVQSANEELQSTNEELETSKEEIQSSNEELATVNDELNNRNVELNRLNDDLTNLFDSVQMAIVILGPDLRIRRFTPAAERALNLIASDVGRTFADIKLNLDTVPDLVPLLAEVQTTARTRELDVRDKRGHWYSLRLHPYRAQGGLVDGLIVMLVDVDAMKRGKAYAESIIATVREPLLVLDERLRVRTASRAYYATFRTTAADTVGRPLCELGNHEWDLPELRAVLDGVVLHGAPIADLEVDRDVEHLGRRTMRLGAQRFAHVEGEPALLLLAIEDVTERNAAAMACARLAAIVESADNAILSMDLGGVITSWNVGAERLFGYRASEAIGQSVHVLVPSERRHEVTDALDRVRRGERMEPYESVCVRRDGSSIDVSLANSPIRDAQGTVIGASKIARDITLRKRTEAALHHSEVRYRRLFETTGDGLLILEVTRGTIVDANPFVCDLLGYTVAELAGKALWEIGLFPDAEANAAVVTELAQKGYLRCEHLPLTTRHARKVDVELVAIAYRENGQCVIQCNLRDITDRISLELQMHEQAAKLSELHRRKDEFLAMLSHELRSPLAPIANAVELLSLQWETESPLQQQARTIIERQMGQLQHLVDDLLEVSRITTGRVQLRRELVAIGDIVAGAGETVRPRIDLRRHELTVSLPPEPIWLSADTARLEQVLANLLANAAKFTYEGGQISLSVRRELDLCVVRVRDTGIGITPAMLPRIFDLFTQAERSLDRSQGGLGIGLALVRRLTELHGGTVSAHSTVGEGSEFVVRLPVASVDAQAATPAVPAPVAAPTRPLRVLVVDDNVDTVLSFAMLLKTLGHDVRSAHDGLSALPAALDYGPDVVLLDIGLPGLNGFEVAKRMRQHARLERAVLVAVTGYGHDADREASRKAGFQHHLVKPARLEQLKEIFARVAQPAD